MYDVSVTRIDEVSTTRWTAGSKRAPISLSFSQDPLAVLERVRDAAIGGATRDLVRDVEAHPDDELEGQMRPAAWQAPGCLRDEARHDLAILTGPDAVTRRRYAAQPDQQE